MTKFRSLVAALAVFFAASAVAIDDADARRAVGGFGSRGARTYTAPPPTPTAPRTAAPIDQSTTPRPPAAAPTSPAAAPQAVPRPSLLGGGLMRGLVIGGLIGLLLGQGFGGLAGVLGLVLQVGLIALVAVLAMRFLAARRPANPAMAGTSYRVAPEAGPGNRPSGLGGGLFGMAAPAPTTRKPKDEIGIGQRDLDTFERLLGEIQMAYGHQDRAALAARSTAEVSAHFNQELDDNAARGLTNVVADVKLLQGDLAEAWREGQVEYATVAMRYQSIDAVRDRSGRVVEGNADRPTEATEVWTFVRDRGVDWKLSAIQEAA